MNKQQYNEFYEVKNSLRRILITFIISLIICIFAIIAILKGRGDWIIYSALIFFSFSGFILLFLAKRKQIRYRIDNKGIRILQAKEQFFSWHDVRLGNLVARDGKKSKQYFIQLFYHNDHKKDDDATKMAQELLGSDLALWLNDATDNPEYIYDKISSYYSEHKKTS